MSYLLEKIAGFPQLPAKAGITKKKLPLAGKLGIGAGAAALGVGAGLGVNALRKKKKTEEDKVAESIDYILEKTAERGKIRSAWGVDKAQNKVTKEMSKEDRKDFVKKNINASGKGNIAAALGLSLGGSALAGASQFLKNPKAQRAALGVGAGSTLGSMYFSNKITKNVENSPHRKEFNKKVIEKMKDMGYSDSEIAKGVAKRKLKVD